VRDVAEKDQKSCAASQRTKPSSLRVHSSNSIKGVGALAQADWRRVRGLVLIAVGSFGIGSGWATRISGGVAQAINRLG
jgi:hypothetical protein